MKLELVEDTRADVINSLHSGIIEKLRTSVQDAIEIGRLLTEQKEDLAHGDFLPWIDENCRFSDDTARRYMSLSAHADKIRSVRNLQEAYQKVAQIETAEKQREKHERERRVEHYEETGEKPAGWQRSDDYELRKRRESEETRERIDASFEQAEQAAGVGVDEINDALRQAEQFTQNEQKHAHLNLSSYAENMTQRDMFSAIERYINTFQAASAQLEATHNLIKKLKLIANGLQAQSARSAS